MRNSRFLAGLCVCSFLLFCGLSNTNKSLKPVGTKGDESEPRHHGHKMPFSEKEYKEPMAKTHYHRSHTESSSNNTILSSTVDSQSVLKNTQRKMFKVESRHGHHQKKKLTNEDYYYTYDEDYETRASTSSSKITNFLKETIGWAIESKTNNSREAHDFFLRGTSGQGH